MTPPPARPVARPSALSLHDAPWRHHSDAVSACELRLSSLRMAARPPRSPPPEAGCANSRIVHTHSTSSAGSRSSPASARRWRHRVRRFRRQAHRAEHCLTCIRASGLRAGPPCAWHRDLLLHWRRARRRQRRCGEPARHVTHLHPSAGGSRRSHAPAGFPADGGDLRGAPVHFCAPDLKEYRPVVFDVRPRGATMSLLFVTPCRAGAHGCSAR